METHPAASSPSPPPKSVASSVQYHPSPRTPFHNRSEILIDSCVSLPFSSPPLCDHDIHLTNHAFPHEPTSSSHGAIKPPTPGRLACEAAFTSLELDSLLSYGDERFPSLHHSSLSTTPSLNPISDDLCSINYSPRFPPGHYLDPTFARTYLLEDELGSGGYGFVMTALHRHLKSEVAIKFVIKEKVPEQAWINHDTLGRIPMEIMLLRMMNHENIVKCLDVFEDELFFYVVSPRIRSC